MKEPKAITKVEYQVSKTLSFDNGEVYTASWNEVRKVPKFDDAMKTGLEVKSRMVYLWRLIKSI